MALSHTTRQSPNGIKLDDGHPTKIAFERAPNIALWEKTVTPPGVDGGDAVDTNTMHNVTWRTMGARKLKTLSEMTFTCAYDPTIYTTIVSSLVNQEGGVTIIFPDGSQVSFYGYLKTFEPDEITEGEMPSASVTVQPTNQDPVTGAETSPLVTSVAGT